MKFHAGIAVFPIPNKWKDFSTYSYHSADDFSSINIVFDRGIKEPTAEAVIEDRLEVIREIMPAFRIEQPLMPIIIGKREGQTLVYSYQVEGDDVRQIRITVVLLAPGEAFVAMVQSPLQNWTEADAAWQNLAVNLVFDSNNSSTL